VPHAVAEEQVRNEERLVDEVGLGVDERELDAVAGEIVQGKERLDPGDPATTTRNGVVEVMAGTLGARGRPGIASGHGTAIRGFPQRVR